MNEIIAATRRPTRRIVQVIVAALLFQVVLLGWHAGAMAAAVARGLETVVICAGGELREVLVDADGQPASTDQAPEPACPFCAVLNVGDVSSIPSDRIVPVVAASVLPGERGRSAEPWDRRPGVRQGQDPPRFL